MPMLLIILLISLIVPSLSNSVKDDDWNPDWRWRYGDYTVRASFSRVNYTWDEEHPFTPQDSNSNDDNFIVSNCAVTGIKIYEGRTFLTVPRWRPGVPATLVEFAGVEREEDGVDVGILRPWPSWDAQTLNGDCSNIQYVQSMEIDTNRREMWVLDVGRRNLLTETPDNTCPPKIMIVDMLSTQIITKYVFPDAIAPYNNSFLNDLVVDVKRQVAYIADAISGAIVVYDRENQVSRRFRDNTTVNDASYNFIVNQHVYGNDTFTTPVDGIALTADTERVFYTPLQGLEVYSVASDALRNLSTTTEDIQNTQIAHGTKHGATDGMTFGCDNTLYYGEFAHSRLMGARSSNGDVQNTEDLRIADEDVVVANAENLHWIDTFAWDNTLLIMVSNRLDLYITEEMEFYNASTYNFHIIAQKTSYAGGYTARVCDTPENDKDPSSLFWLVFGGCAIVILALLGYCYCRQVRKMSQQDVTPPNVYGEYVAVQQSHESMGSSHSLNNLSA